MKVRALCQHDTLLFDVLGLPVTEDVSSLQQIV
jgi:hypothetical protein